MGNTVPTTTARRDAPTDHPPADLDAYPAGTGDDLLLVGEHRETEWLQSDTHTDTEDCR